MHPLLSELTGSSPASGENGAPVDPAVWRELHTRLAPVIGPRGFDALVQRSLADTRERYPFLPDDVDAASDPDALVARFDNLPEAEGEEESGALAAVIDSLLRSLEDLIGPALLRRLLASDPRGNDPRTKASA